MSPRKKCIYGRGIFEIVLNFAETGVHIFIDNDEKLLFKLISVLNFNFKA